jgi:hypothetical protein
MDPASQILSMLFFSCSAGVRPRCVRASSRSSFTTLPTMRTWISAVLRFTSARSWIWCVDYPRSRSHLLTNAHSLAVMISRSFRTRQLSLRGLRTGTTRASTPSTVALRRIPRSGIFCWRRGSISNTSVSSSSRRVWPPTQVSNALTSP